MIGIKAFLLDLPFMVMPLLFGWAAYKEWRSDKSTAKLLTLGLVVLLFLVFANRFLHNLSYYHELRTMSTGELSGFEIDGKLISNPQDVSNIVNALHESEWFSYNHGGAARKVTLTVHFKNGGLNTYPVGYYLREAGAVVEFRQRWANGVEVSYGEAFCRKLPAALESAGTLLPRN
jgi:hypothetical protein